MDERDAIREEARAADLETEAARAAVQTAREAEEEPEAETEEERAAFEAALREAHQEIQPRKGRRILAIVLVIVAAAAAAAGGWFYHTKNREAMDGLTEAFLTVDAAAFDYNDSAWKETYPKYSGKTYLEESLVSGIDQLAADGDLGQIGNTVQVMEALNYERESVKTAVDNAVAAEKDAAFRDEDSQALFTFVEETACMGGLTYYTPFEEFLPAGALSEELRTRAEALCKAGEPNALLRFVDGLEELCALTPGMESGAKANEAEPGQTPEGYVRADDILPAGLLLDTVVPRAEPAIFESGEGGYYDFAGEGSSQKSSGATRSRGAWYYGDFMTIHSSTTLDSANGDGDGEAADSSASLYFRGETIAAVSTFMQVIDRGVREMLIWDDVIVAIGPDWIELLQGSASDGLVYAEEIDLSTWELEPERTADLTDAAVFREIETLLQEKLEDYEAELRYDVTAQELQILVTAPVDDPADMDEWAALGERLLELYDGAETLCEDAGYTVECAAYIVQSTDSEAVLYCIRDGRTVYDASTDDAADAPVIGGSPADDIDNAPGVNGVAGSEIVLPGSIDPDEVA